MLGEDTAQRLFPFSGREFRQILSHRRDQLFDPKQAAHFVFIEIFHQQAFLARRWTNGKLQGAAVYKPPFNRWAIWKPPLLDLITYAPGAIPRSSALISSHRSTAPAHRR